MSRSPAAADSASASIAYLQRDDGKLVREPRKLTILSGHSPAGVIARVQRKYLLCHVYSLYKNVRRGSVQNLKLKMPSKPTFFLHRRFLHVYSRRYLEMFFARSAPNLV